MVVAARRALRVLAWCYTPARLRMLLAAYLTFNGALRSARADETDAAGQLTPLRYNNLGLVVDLGVGLWAWPAPCDADSDGDFDLIVSCPDKPSNGIWLFENTTGDTARDKFPMFQPARRLSRTVHYVMPSYVDGRLRVLSPGKEYPDFLSAGLDRSAALAVPEPIHTPQGTAPQARGNKMRHNQWRYADYDGDGRQDLIVGIEDWSDYGWDDAWNASGHWQNGPLHGFVYWLRNTGSSDAPRYASAEKVQAGGGPVDTYGCPSPNFADFDSDGDLDLLCGEFLDGLTYFENTGTRTAPRYSIGRRLKTSDGRPLVMDLEMIVPVAFDWDRDGDLDMVVGDEDGRVALVENTARYRPIVRHVSGPALFPASGRHVEVRARWRPPSDSIGTATVIPTSFRGTRPATSSGSKTSAVRASQARVGMDRSD